MYILTSDEKSILNTKFVERFCIVEKPDACLIIASYSQDRAVTIGKYADRKEADDAFYRLFNNLVGNDGSVPFAMPDSVMFHGETMDGDETC